MPVQLNGPAIGQSSVPGDEFQPLPLPATADSAMSGGLWRATVAGTLTIPAGVALDPGLIVMPPASGDLTITVSGGATLNGGTSSIVATRAQYPAGVAVVAYGANAYGVVLADAWRTLSLPATADATFSSGLLRAAGSGTLTLPAGAGIDPGFVVMPPAAGTLTIAVSGGATINGGSTSVTRTRADNPGGVAVMSYGSDAYGVTGV